MKRYAALFALAFLAGCTAQEAKKAEHDAAAELKKAKDAAATELKADLDATKKAADSLRAGAAQLDKDLAEAYHAAATDLDKAHDAASSAWDKAAQAAEADWHKLGQEAKDAAAAARKAARRVEALAGDVKVAADIRKDYDALKKSLGKAKDATGEEWKDLRHGVNRDLRKLRAKLHEAREKIEKA